MTEQRQKSIPPMRGRVRLIACGLALILFASTSAVADGDEHRRRTMGAGGSPRAAGAGHAAVDRNLLMGRNNPLRNDAPFPVPMKRQRLIMNADNDQRYMTSKIYTLRHVNAVDVAPWVLGAVKRNCPQAAVERNPYPAGDCTLLTVSMSVDMVPYIDDMVSKLDRPGVKEDEYGSIIDGTDVTFYYYTPKYRSNDNLIEVILGTLQGRNIQLYREPLSNQFYWKDAKADGSRALTWLNFLDRPVPQMDIRIKTYEVLDSDLVDVGLDYVRIKNGPGLEMFGIGADLLSIDSHEELFQRGLEIFTTVSQNWSGFFIAPHIDASFVRLMQQRGRAWVAASGSITVTNDSPGEPTDRITPVGAPKTFRISYSPDFQNIAKDERMRLSVASSDDSNPVIAFEIRRPAIFFDPPDRLQDKDDNESGRSVPPARIMFTYGLTVRNTVLNDVMGNEAVDEYRTESFISVPSGGELMIGNYHREFDVRQRIGIPFLKDIPVLGYLFGTSTHSREVRHYFVTVAAGDVPLEADLSAWAGEVVSDVEGEIKAMKSSLRVD